MDSLSISVLCIIPYAIATHIHSSNASRSSSQTKPKPENEFEYPQTYFGPPCQEPDFVPISKDVDIAPSATYALPPPSVSEPDFLETCKTLVKKLADHLTPERIRAIVFEFKRMVDQALPIEVILARLSTLLADKPNLLRSLELLAFGNLLVTIHPHRTYLTILSDGPNPHAVSWFLGLDPPKARTPPTAPVTPLRPLRTAIAGPSPPAPPTLGSVTVNVPHPHPHPHPSSQVRVVIADPGPAKRMSLSRAFLATLNTRLAHKPAVRAELFRLFAVAAASPFAPNPNANLKTEDFPAGSGAFVGLAFGSLNGPADVRRAGALLLNDPDLLRGLAELVDGEGARAELAKGIELSEMRAVARPPSSR